MRDVLFCSILDGSFVARWLVMHRSLLRHRPGARALAFCLDEHARAAIERLTVPGVRTMSLAELETRDRDLVATRGTRSAREYMFTVKPCLYRHLLEVEDAGAVLHVDADMRFFSDPAPLVDGLEAGSVLLVPSGHARAHAARLDEVYGAYQAGLIGFRRDERGRVAAARWREQCLDWCGAEPEPGRWANKRYLNEWPGTLDGVHVADATGLGTAAWSLDRHELGEREGRVLLDGRPLVLFHYSGMSFAAGPRPLLRAMALTRALRRQPGSVPFTWGHSYRRPGRRERALIWAPYAQDLSAALAAVHAIGVTGPDGLGRPWVQIREVVLRRRVLWGAAWGVRHVLDVLRRRVRSQAVRHWVARRIGALDALRKRWRVE